MDMIKKTTPTFKKVSETKSNLGKEKKNTIHVKNKYLHPIAYSQCVTYTSLSMKQGSMFCFVLFVMLIFPKSWLFILHSWYFLNVLNE
jgi:hypothetical protein